MHVGWFGVYWPASGSAGVQPDGCNVVVAVAIDLRRCWARWWDRLRDIDWWAHLPGERCVAVVSWLRGAVKSLSACGNSAFGAD